MGDQGGYVAVDVSGRLCLGVMIFSSLYAALLGKGTTDKHQMYYHAPMPCPLCPGILCEGPGAATNDTCTVNECLEWTLGANNKQTTVSTVDLLRQL